MGAGDCIYHFNINTSTLIFYTLIIDTNKLITVNYTITSFSLSPMPGSKAAVLFPYLL